MVSVSYANSFNTARRPVQTEGYLTDYWTDESIKAIKPTEIGRFSLPGPLGDSYTPQATRADEAVGDIEPHRLRVYVAMTRALDRSVGRVTAALEQKAGR